MALRVDDVDLVRDRALVERFQLGDPAAFETLYRRYFARLVRFCQKRVGDPLEAEEIAQEAFTRALRAMPTFEGERRFYPWMTVIAGRLCVDSHRRRSRSEPSSEIELGLIEGGQEKIVDAVDVEILATALGRIAPRHREVLDLREQQGRSYQEIADHYGVTLGTVEALLFRARKALKREFMAVVGDERNWAAVPVLGLVLRRVASWKAKLDAVLPAAPSLAGPVMAAVVAITAVTGAVGLTRNDHPPQTAAAPRTVVLGMEGLPASVADLAAVAAAAAVGAVAGAQPAGVPEAGTTASPQGPGATNPTPEEVVVGAVDAVTVSDYEGGSEVAEEDPVRVEPLPGEFVTSNPGGTTTDLADRSTAYLGQLGARK